MNIPAEELNYVIRIEQRSRFYLDALRSQLPIPVFATKEEEIEEHRKILDAYCKTWLSYRDKL